MSANRQVNVSPAVLEQAQAALADLVKEPLPSYGYLGLDIIIHAGKVIRIKTNRENQIQVDQNGHYGN
jgi:hypothetical protein